ncbi:hypothetical protein WA538_005368, partial [Blastocystis sp. DL]
MDPQEALKNAGAEQATIVGGARTKPSNYVPSTKEGAAEMKSLVNGTTTAGAEIILNEEARLAREADYYPKAELREISQHNQKPSPKLQAKPMNKNQNHHI